MGTVISFHEKIVVKVKSGIFAHIYDAIYQRFINTYLGGDLEGVLAKMYTGTGGVGFSIEDLVKTKKHALFWADAFQVAVKKVQHEHPQLLTPEAIKMFTDLSSELYEYAHQLPEKALIMKFEKKWRQPIVEIDCVSYGKFLRYISHNIQHSSFKFTYDIIYHLETGTYGFDVSLSTLLATKIEYLEFAKYFRQAIDNLQASSEPLDILTEQKFRTLYKHILEIAETNS